MSNKKSSRSQKTKTKKKKKKKKARSFRTNVIVQIYLDSSNKLKVDTPEAEVKPGGRITFKIRPQQNLKSFVVLLKKETPFGNGKTWAGGHKGRGAMIRIDGLANGPKETDTTKYSYSVLATDGSKTYHMDPDIVVGPRTGTW